MGNFESILKTIKESDVITIWGHALPDGDCYGCQIGLRDIIKANFPEKRVYAVGTGMSNLYERIGKMDEVDEKVIAASLAILVDVSCLRRVEDQRVNKAKRFAKFDHHTPNKEGESFPYPDFFVDHQRISCAEIVETFAFEMGLKIPKSAAEALYLGILTDSGGFRFYGTDEHTIASVKRLMKLGVEPISIRKIVYYEDERTKAFRLYLCQNVKRHKNVSYVYLTQEDYLSRSMSYEEAGSMVNAIEGITNPDIYCLFTEDGKGEIRGELRSDKGFPLVETAKRFHGGGHLFAAGTSTYSYEESMKLVDELSKVTPMPL